MKKRLFCVLDETIFKIYCLLKIFLLFNKNKIEKKTKRKKESAITTYHIKT